MDSKQIAERNDRLRTTFIPSPQNQIVLTASVNEASNRHSILKAVKEFKDFSEANDPYGEHDFGLVEVEGETYFFKCDYLDSNLEYGVDPYEEDYILVLTIGEETER